MFDCNYIRIDETGGGGLFYKGTFKALGDAIVDAMLEMKDRVNAFKGDGEYYRLDPMFRMDGDCAYCIVAHFKANCWEKEVTEKYYFIKGDKNA